MNKVFKIIWNTSMQMFIVVSELAKGYCHSSATINNHKRIITSFVLTPIALAISLSFSPALYATTEIEVQNSKPQNNPEVTISGDTTLVGDFSLIKRGEDGSKLISLGKAKEDKLLSQESADLIESDILRMGSQTKSIGYTDKVTGNTVTMNVFDTNNIKSESSKDFYVTISFPVGADGQYVDRNFYKIGSGASLDVKVGSDTVDWVRDTITNRFNVILKSSSTTENKSSAFYVTDGGQLSYSTKTVVQLGNADSNNIKDGNNPLTWMNVAKFLGSFSSVLGQQNVTNLDEFKAYNEALIKAIQEGKIQLTESQYAAELNKARDTKAHGIFPNNTISEDDAVRKVINKDVVSYIHGKDENSKITINENANIQLYGSDATLVNLENKAELTNNGTLGTAQNTIKGAYVVVAKSGSIVNNNGVIDAGTNQEMRNVIPETVSQGAHQAILAKNATVNNNSTGIINLSSVGSFVSSNQGVELTGSSIFNNWGTINIAASQEGGVINDGGVNRGVIINNNSTFNHSGTLYIGRSAQSELNGLTSDLTITQPSVGVKLSDAGEYSGDINSKIIIGKQVRNAFAIDVLEGKKLDQKGMIDIYGSSNTGIRIGWTQGYAQQIENSGVINLNGLDGKGIHVIQNGKITSSGTININGGLDPTTRLANYGIYAEGEKAVATLSGEVNLKGEGAIAVHARNGGQVNVIENGVVNFISGKNQIGYYIYGAGSSIKNSSTSQSVSTQGSTLYRVDSGAAFKGPTGGSLVTLNATANSSTIVQTTGAGSTFDSGDLSLSIEGENSTGIRIEGGANGTITSDKSIVKVSGQNATAGIVDGNYYNRDGTVNALFKGNSILTSYAELGTAQSASGAFGYITRNGGKLEHYGKINFTESEKNTGILVDGGILDNHSEVKVNGIAVDIQGKDSIVTNSGTVTATDGTAAYRVGSETSLTLNGNGTTNAAGTAHGILLDDGAIGLSIDGATIKVAADGKGNAIENVAAISGIQLKNTTISVGNGIGVHTGASLAQTNSGTINVSGSGTGILFENINGTTTSQSLDMSDSKDLVINVNSANGKGIVTNTSTDLKTGTSVNVLDSAGNAALIVKGTTKNIAQSGVLTSISDSSAVVKIDNSTLKTFTNKGTIKAKDKDHKALEMTSDSSITFTNATGGAITGEVNLLSGNNTVILETGSTATDITTTIGDDLFILKNIDNESNLFTSLNGGAGTDTLQLENAKYTLTNADAITGMEKIELNNKSELTLDNISLALGDDKSDGAGTGYTIDSSSKLNLKSTTDLTFKSHLAGNGTVTVDAAGNNFNFTGNNKADGFAGTVALTNSKFELSGKNTQALTSATLLAGTGSITHVDTGTQNIGGLAFGGGTIQFGDLTPGKTESKGTIKATNMDLTGTGIVQVNIDDVSSHPPVSPSSDLSILEQDEGNILVTLAKSVNTVKVSAGELKLKDQNNNPITDSLTKDIKQNGSVVAKGTYDYRLTSGNSSDGLYINYGLTQVELLGTGNNALILDANGKTGNAADLSAKIIGNGDLAVNSQKGQTVTLSNSANNYTGLTDVRSGNLAMLNDNVLGQTSELKLATNTGFDMQGHSQTIGKLTAANGSLTNLNSGQLTLTGELTAAKGSITNLNNGHLTLTNGGTAEGELTGGGKLIVADGTLNVKGENANLSAETTIATSATVAILNNTQGLGSGDIITVGTLELNQANGTLANNISDKGTVALKGSEVTLAGNNSNFNGLFDIDNASNLTASEAKQLGDSSINNIGILMLDTNSDWTLDNQVNGTGNFVKNGLGTVTLKNSAKWTGNTDINQGKIVLGGSEDAEFILDSSQVNIDKSGQLSGFGGVAGNIDNKGTLLVGTESTVGNDFIVNGNYVGNGGILYLNTVLGDDDSATDKLTITGDTSGKTSVNITNIGGAGAQTVNGIEVIHVDGQSNGLFTLSRRLVVGAYDYGLVKIGKDWYLTSRKQNAKQNVRPEAGSYTANIAAANTLFVTRLHDRLGDTQYVDALTGEKKVTSMWIRQVGGHNKWRDSTGQLQTQNNRYVMQLGGDIASWSIDGLDRWHLGVMAGYGHNSSNTHSSAKGYGSKGSVNGYSIGGYATWYANDQTHQGLYIDSWAQYNWFNNSVKGDDIQQESYKSKGFTASLESGYTYKLSEFTGTKGKSHEWFIQPQAQAIWMGVKADNVRESNASRTLIQGKGEDNIQTRLGLRTFINNKNITEDNIESNIQPYVEANWIHNTRSFGTQMDAVTIRQAGARNLGEIKTGIEGQIDPQLNIWGNVALQAGEQGYKDVSAMIGVKYNF